MQKQNRVTQLYLNTEGLCQWWYSKHIFCICEGFYFMRILGHFTLWIWKHLHLCGMRGTGANRIKPYVGFVFCFKSCSPHFFTNLAILHDLFHLTTCILSFLFTNPYSRFTLFFAGNLFRLFPFYLNPYIRIQWG